MTQTIEQLTARVRELEKEVGGWRNQAHQSQSAFERTQEQLLSAQAEIKRLEERRCEICGYAEHHREHTGCLRNQLAAAQLNNKRLRDALIATRDDLELRMRITEDDSLNISNSALDKMLDAIDTPTSTEALDKYVEELGG